jgi:hypothetical protein
VSSDLTPVPSPEWRGVRSEVFNAGILAIKSERRTQMQSNEPLTLTRRQTAAFIAVWALVIAASFASMSLVSRGFQAPEAVRSLILRAVWSLIALGGATLLLIWLRRERSHMKAAGLVVVMASAVIPWVWPWWFGTSRSLGVLGLLLPLPIRTTRRIPLTGRLFGLLLALALLAGASQPDDTLLWVLCGAMPLFLIALRVWPVLAEALAQSERAWQERERSSPVFRWGSRVLKWAAVAIMVLWLCMMVAALVLVLRLRMMVFR